VRVMCLNAWGGTLYQPLIDYIAKEAPDVLCLQEVVHTPTARKDVLTYRDGAHVLPQRSNLFRDVSNALPEHSATFAPAAQGVLWDGDEPVPSQWGLATFVHRSHPIVAQHQGFVHKNFSPEGYGDHPRSRSAHTVRLYDYERNWAVCVAHMHGLRDIAGKADTPERVVQARRFADICRSVMEEGDRLVACGDFNVEPSSETFMELAKLGLTDLVTARGFTDTRTSHYAKPGRYADYLLVNELVEPISFEVVTSPEVSDHRPLLLEL
jgi:endonuclease/exonuclease/phosphatase family metal-dependent hydrolase